MNGIANDGAQPSAGFRGQSSFAACDNKTMRGKEANEENEVEMGRDDEKIKIKKIKNEETSPSAAVANGRVYSCMRLARKTPKKHRVAGAIVHAAIAIAIRYCAIRWCV